MNLYIGCVDWGCGSETYYLVKAENKGAAKEKMKKHFAPRYVWVEDIEWDDDGMAEIIDVD